MKDAFMKTSFWGIEDTFFGAILGAFIGIFIKDLLLGHAILIILFIVLFPLTLRKAEKIAKNALILALLINILWIVGFTYELHSSSVMELDKVLSWELFL